MLMKKRKLKRNWLKPKNEEQNFHKSLRFLFLVAQLFGLFPVQGVLKENSASLGFSWCSVKIASSVITCIGGTMIVLGLIKQMVIDGYSQSIISSTIFYFCGILSCILFIKIAKEWKNIMLKWSEVDHTMAAYGWPKNLNRKLKIISIVFLSLEAVEHVSVQMNKLITAVQCRGSLSKGFEHVSVNLSYPMIFNTINYSPWLGIAFQCVNSRIAFSWTFNDLFIILISCALVSRFQQINIKIKNMKDMKVQSERSWIKVNEDYNRLCRLCAFLDDKISWLILSSFFNNFYFIILMIFESMTLHQSTALEIFYYFVSLGLLILRVIYICLYGSWIYEESKLPLNLLSSIPHEIYNKEISRFTENIKYQTVGLTGKKLFRVTKQLILKIAGAVVTYELMVVQFNENVYQQKPLSKNPLC